MKIKTADSKGRVLSGKPGTLYYETKAEDGTITLKPLTIPDVPEMPGRSQAIYVSPGRYSSPATITVHADIGNFDAQAELISKLAREHGLPVIVNSAGLGIALADLLVDAGVENVVSFNPALAPVAATD